MARDGCLILTESLASAVRGFLDEWGCARPPTGGQFASGGGVVEDGPMRGVEWLAYEAGVSERTITRIVGVEREHIRLSMGDRIVTALGHPEWLWDGTVTVVENPEAPAHVRASCCAGSGGRDSLTGSL